MSTKRYNIKVANQYEAILELTTQGMGFQGVVTSKQFGAGSISGSIAGAKYVGQGGLGPIQAQFEANISPDGKSVSGQIHAGWFFDKPFTGTLIDEEAAHRASQDAPVTQLGRDAAMEKAEGKDVLKT